MQAIMGSWAVGDAKYFVTNMYIQPHTQNSPGRCCLGPDKTQMAPSGCLQSYGTNHPAWVITAMELVCPRVLPEARRIMKGPRKKGLKNEGLTPGSDLNITGNWTSSFGDLHGMWECYGKRKCSSTTKNPCQRQGVRAEVPGHLAAVHLHYSV